jgi:uncharacterized protein (DUF2141 family)
LKDESVKQINPVVVLLTLAALAGGFLIIEESPDSAPSGSMAAGTESHLAAASAESQPAKIGPHETKSFSTNAVSVSKRDVACRISGLKAQPCNVYVAVFESEPGFPKSEQSTMTTIVPATEDHVEVSLSLPENQSAAIAVFQDLDGNGKLSKNTIGLPVEPYGFSNNARALMGPPSFQQAVIQVSNAVERLEIRVR